MRVVWLLVALVFVVAGAVQFNDPDSLGWVGVYWAAALACGVWGWRTGWSRMSQRAVIVWVGLVGVVAVVWMATIFDEVLEVGAVDLSSEVQREFGGLVLVFAVMNVLFVSDARRAFWRKGAVGVVGEGAGDSGA